MLVMIMMTTITIKVTMTAAMMVIIRTMMAVVAIMIRTMIRILTKKTMTTIKMTQTIQWILMSLMSVTRIPPLASCYTLKK